MFDFKEYFDFGPERAYILLAIARSKENEGIKSSNQPVIRKVVENEDEVDDKIEQLQHATSRFDHKYRIYGSVNARNTTKALFSLQDKVTDWQRKAMKGDEQVKKNFKQIDHKWKSQLHSLEARDDNRFLYDIDATALGVVKMIETELEDHTTIILNKETPNGYHIVTEPFNYNELQLSYLDRLFELKKDAMIFGGYL